MAFEYHRIMFKVGFPLGRDQVYVEVGSDRRRGVSRVCLCRLHWRHVTALPTILVTEFGKRCLHTSGSAKTGPCPCRQHMLTSTSSYSELLTASHSVPRDSQVHTQNFSKAQLSIAPSEKLGIAKLAFTLQAARPNECMSAQPQIFMRQRCSS